MFTLIGFTDDEMGRIHEYMEQAEAINTKVAILNAISVASDRLDFIDDTVVRCKYCMYHRNNPVAPCLRVLRGEDADENWFCADGRRRKFADQDVAQHGDQDVLMPATRKEEDLNADEKENCSHTYSCGSDGHAGWLHGTGSGESDTESQPTG